ncbi:HAD-IIB family hydrolase [Limnochorda pilosa]|uniref:Hydrolase n=1 Tax=Limnochorda pilosa TaxID=1555112 RepID=A0A0K2SJD1_LIMPI|nr:HAD-IIB family hydrolase [Limnochorda pilosa]BAS27226.1 hydrolase [Limnochorda pilosa]
MAHTPHGPRLVLATDLDDTLVGEPDGLQALWHALDRLEPHRLLYLTGRSLESAQGLMHEVGLRTPDVLVTDVGTQVWRPSAGGAFVEDEAWAARLDAEWDGPRVDAAVRRVEGLEPQPVRPSRFRASFWLTRPEAQVVPRLRRALERAGLSVQIIVSAGVNVDLLPPPAGKGAALRYLVEQGGWPEEAVLACGDSGNDRSMLEAGFRAVVVGGYRPELESLRGRPRLHFAQARAAWGILEGLEHHGWPTTSHPPSTVTKSS